MDYCGVFADEFGRVLQIRRVDDSRMPFRIRVVLPDKLDLLLRSDRDYPFEIVNELIGWIHQKSSPGECLIIEGGVLGQVGIGPTLKLKPVAEDVLMPSVSIGFYDDWEEDAGLPWAFPLSCYRRQGQDVGD